MQLKNIMVALAIVSIAFSAVCAQEKTEPGKSDGSFAAQIGNYSKRKAATQKYTLAYKFKKGDVIQWQHDHQTFVETRFGTASDKTSTRSRPDFKWTVRNVDARGNIRFDIEMQRIKVLEQTGEADPVNYDSDKHKEAPPSCVAYQERVGRVCSTYSISPNGQVVDSKSNYYQLELNGFFSVGNNPVVAFPNKPISVGHKWAVPNFVRATDEYGVKQQLQLRVLYEFQKVVDGKAHITFTTNVLTPNVDETMRSQIVAHLTRGFIVFDIGKGVLTNRETTWDERIIGYQGPESYMHYTARRNETLVQEQQLTSMQPNGKVDKHEPAKQPKQVKQASYLQPLQPMKK